MTDRNGSVGSFQAGISVNAALEAMINPSRLRVIAVGKVRKRWVSDGLALYLKRLPGLSIVEVKDSTPEKEADAVWGLLLPAERLVALTEEGCIFDSVGFAHWLDGLASDRIALVIGGAEGLAPSLKARAMAKLSLSPMTFPHEIARLLLVEQIYRGVTILQGGPYHKA
jgi:23S rRNA (pseudouridine1915-N3)-methyltransferase